MSKTVLWSSARASFDDGFHRRRVSIPAAGLRALGWRTPATGSGGAGVLVLDGMAAEDLAQAQAASAAGVAVVLDASRWVCAGTEDAPSETLRLIADLADRVVAPSEALAEAVGAALGCTGKLAVVPDPVETPTVLQVAAMAEGRPFHPKPLAVSTEPLAVWFATADDEQRLAVELERLPALADQAREAGLGFLALAPEGALGQVRDRLGAEAEVGVWTLEAGPAELSRASVCILPGPDGGAGWSTIRRAALAEAIGLPVLAPSGPGWETGSPRRLQNAWTRGIELAASGELAIAAAGEPLAPAAAFDAALAWDDLLSGLGARPSGQPAPVRLLIVLDLIQDGELCLPVVREAAARSDIEVKLVVTSWFARNASATMKALGRLDHPMQVVEREALLAGEALKDEVYDALLVAVATDLRAHRHPQAAVEAAKAAGALSFSMQHGLENVGLTFFDSLHSDEVDITSDYVFVWFSPDFAPPSPLALRRKFIHVGAVKSARSDGPPPPLPNDQRPLVSVFENLHWHRYDHDFRQRFIADLIEAANAAPSTHFVLKPHPAGMWTKGQALPRLPDNLMVIDPTDPAWASVSAQAVIARSDRVITTPSTVAVDAALARRPVAVVGYNLDLPVYVPLPILRQAGDWRSFTGPRGRSLAGDAVLDAFLRRRLLRDEAAPHLLDALVDRVRRLR